jgi:MoaA/NifB/PqqE/SkfB family radical SAM enzyme
MSTRKALHLDGFDFARSVSLYQEGKIPHVDFATSKICNLLCTYCAVGGGEADPGELTLEELKDVLKQCADLGAVTTSVTGMGEPLLDKKYLPVTEYIHKLGLAQALFTNGTRITREVAETLNKNGVSPVVKLNCLVPEVHNELVGKSDGFDLAWRGLQNILAVYDQPSDESITRIGIQTLVTKSTVKHIPDLLKFCRENRLYPVVDLIIASGKMVALRNYEQYQITSQENEWLCGEFTRIMGYPGYGVQGEADGCPYAIGICIDNIGNVPSTDTGISCLSNNRIVGNVKEESVDSIYKKLMQVRQSAGFKCTYKSSGSKYFLPCPERVRAERAYYDDKRQTKPVPVTPYVSTFRTS